MCQQHLVNEPLPPADRYRRHLSFPIGLQGTPPVSHGRNHARPAVPKLTPSAGVQETTSDMVAETHNNSPKQLLGACLASRPAQSALCRRPCWRTLPRNPDHGSISVGSHENEPRLHWNCCHSTPAQMQGTTRSARWQQKLDTLTASTLQESFQITSQKLKSAVESLRDQQHLDPGNRGRRARWETSRTHETHDWETQAAVTVDRAGGSQARLINCFVW
jgi:hypothetical protein